MPARFDGSVAPAADASLVLFVDKGAETLEIMFYESDEDTTGRLIAMTGSLEDHELVRWLTCSAAERHGIEFREERLDPDGD